MTTPTLVVVMLAAGHAHARQVIKAFGGGFTVALYILSQFFHSSLIISFVYNQLPADLPYHGPLLPDPILLIFHIKLAVLAGLTTALLAVANQYRQTLRRWTWYPTTGHERVKLLLSGGLFIVGMIAGQALFTPVIFHLVNIFKLLESTEHTTITWMEVLLGYLIAAGSATSLPVVVSSLGNGSISAATLRATWRYAALGILTLAAVLTPTSVYTQLVWAIPVFFLYLSSVGLVTILSVLHNSTRITISDYLCFLS